MRLLFSICLLLMGTIGYGQSDKDMIIASWKCVAIDQAAVQPASKEQKTVAPKADAPNIDGLRKEQLGTVYGFRNNGTVIINKDGAYNARQYKVEGNTLSINSTAVYTILDLNYRTMTWRDQNGLIYKFERE